MATTIWMVVRTYSPVLFGDQWELIRTLMRSHGHPSLRDFWAQHNEHRILTGRLLGFADLYIFGGRNISLLTEIVAIQFCHVVLFLVVIRRFESLAPAVYITLAGFLIYCLFSPIQIENFIWGFQTVFVLTSLAATAACMAAVFHARRAGSGEGTDNWGFLFLAIVAAFVAEASEAHGLVTWGVLLFLAFALRFPRRDKAVVSLAAALAIALYAIGFQASDPPQAMIEAVRHPERIFHFVVTYLGKSWDSHLPNASAWPAVSESLTCLIIVATLASSAWSLWRPGLFSPFQVALLGNLLFVLGSAAMTAVGRLRLGGLQGATAIRYQTPALVFWASLAILITTLVDWRPPQRLLVAQVTVLILTLAGGAPWVEMGRVAEARQAVEEMGWNALVEGRFDDPAVADIFYEPNHLKPLFLYLRHHGWGPGGEITSFARLQHETEPSRINGHRVEPQACLGHWDRVRRSGLRSVSVGGWALSPTAGQVTRRVAFASNTGKIIGYAELSRVRQDVADQYPAARKLTTGWDANLSVPGEGVYHAFLLFEDTGVACPIGGELRIRHFPVF